MCLITTQIDPKVLKKDLRVYKILIKKSNSSAFQIFHYKKGQTYKTTLEFSDDMRSFDKISTQDRDTLIEEGKLVLSIGPGFHSAKTRQRLLVSELLEDEYIAVFIIPKGAMYYEDRTGLIVSDQIKFIK